MIKITIGKKKVEKTPSAAFAEIADKIGEYHKEFDALLKGTTEVEKAFILGTYVWNLNAKSRRHHK
jgi:hypothetical protein